MKKTLQADNPDPEYFSLEQLATAMMAARGINEGRWHLGVKLAFGGNTQQWKDKDELTQMPTGLVGIGGMSLTKTDSEGMLVFDAAKLNPRPKNTRATARKKAVTK